MKLYIRETKEKTVDDEELMIYEVAQSELQPLAYIVFTDK